MNESKFHHVLFKPSTHLFHWSEIAKAICRAQILPDLPKPFASEIFVKLNKTVRANDSQTYSATRSTIWKIIFFATSERQTLCNTKKVFKIVIYSVLVGIVVVS